MNSRGWSRAVGRLWNGTLGLDPLRQLGGRGVELQRRVRLAGAGLAGDEDGPVVVAEGRQVTVGVQHGDAHGDPGGLGGTAGGRAQKVGLWAGERCLLERAPCVLTQ